MNFVKLHHSRGDGRHDTRHSLRRHIALIPVMVRVIQIVRVEPYFEENSNGDLISRSKVFIAGSVPPIYATESVEEVLDLISEVEKNKKS